MEFIKRYKLPTINIFKIDIEGAELAVLENFNEEILFTTSQITVEFHDFLDLGDLYLSRFKKIIKKLHQNNYLVVRISTEDWRETLCINKHQVNLSIKQKIRLQLIHPLLQLVKRGHIKLANYLK